MGGRVDQHALTRGAVTAPSSRGAAPEHIAAPEVAVDERRRFLVVECTGCDPLTRPEEKVPLSLSEVGGPSICHQRQQRIQTLLSVEGPPGGVSAGAHHQQLVSRAEHRRHSRWVIGCQGTEGRARRKGPVRMRQRRSEGLGSLAARHTGAHLLQREKTFLDVEDLHHGRTADGARLAQPSQPGGLHLGGPRRGVRTGLSKAHGRDCTGNQHEKVLHAPEGPGSPRTPRCPDGQHIPRCAARPGTRFS